MAQNARKTAISAVGATLVFLGISGCSQYLPEGFTLTESISLRQPSLSAPNQMQTASVSDSDKNCLMRAMYFESNRSSEEGMLAVGTVVMNRVASPRFDNSICAVVGAPRQFAPGVLTRAMSEDRPRALANSVAERVLRGDRHPGVRTAKFFHTAGLSFPYSNMNYVLEAGGNAFYIKTTRR